jgi:hypothetical protein
VLKTVSTNGDGVAKLVDMIAERVSRREIAVNGQVA